MSMCKHCGKTLDVPRQAGGHVARCASNPRRFVATRKTNEEIFTVNSTYARHHVKSRVIADKLVPYQCSICGIGPEWQGKPIPLILDHKNGVNNDNRIDNLRFVCSNCDSQLDTYKARNKGRRASGLAPRLESE